MEDKIGMSSILAPGKGESNEELIKNRIELLRVADEVFRKHLRMMPTIDQYLNDILNLGKNIDLYVSVIEPPEQILWKSKYSNLFSLIFPAINKYTDYLGIMLRILVLDQTDIYTPELITHLIILMIGDELMEKGVFTHEKAKQIASVFLNLLNIMREFFRRHNLCLRALSGSIEGLSIDELIASENRGAPTFLIQWLAADLIERDDDMRGIYILASQERHVAAILHKTATVAKLDRILETVETQMALNASRKKEEKAGAIVAAAAAEAAAAAAVAAAEKAAAELLNENLKEKTATATKAAKEKQQREAKKARREAEAEAAEAAVVAAEKAEADRIAAEKKAAKNAIKKSTNLLAASMKQRAPELMTPVRAPLTLKKPAASPPAPSPASLPSSVSPASSTPTLLLPPAPPPSVLPLPPTESPPNLSNLPGAITPSLAKTGFTPYTRPPPVTRFWEILDHRHIYRILHDIFINTQNIDTRFYLKGSAAIHLYKRAYHISITNHTSDYDTTLLVNPRLSKREFYDLRLTMLARIMHRLIWSIDDQQFNAEVITKLGAAGIPYASFVYYDATKREPVYAIQDKIPQDHVTVPDKSAPKFYSDRENHFPYASYAAKPSTSVLNLRILRALEKPKNVTVIQLYTKTSPEIKLIEVTVPFYEYNENETQISLGAQWVASNGIPVIDGVPVLSLPALKAEQQKLRTLKDAAEIDRRIADIDLLMRPAGGAGGSARRRTRKLRG